jgi:flagellar basal body-associated protein FliL
MKRGYLIIIILFLIAAGIFGYMTWLDYQQASVIIDWTTASEIDTAGFNVYRSMQSDLGYRRVNAALIPASQEPLTGGVYSYTDFGVEPGKIYFYLLEDVSMDGQVTRHGPIEVKAQANYWLNFSILIILLAIAILIVAVRAGGVMYLLSGGRLPPKDKPL